MKFAGFEKGMGIGGWLTNYKRFNVLPEEIRLDLTIGDEEHFKTYITERDVKYIADLGMDHIRLGFDQIVLEEAPGVYRPWVFEIIDDFIGWCEKYHLNVILNLHKAVGNYCDIPEKVQLLDDAGLQERFIALWLAFEKRYHEKKGIVFEILNEVRDVDAEKWNTLAENTIAAIRKENETRYIMVGSTNWNDPGTLKDMKLFDDPYVVYTFHIYAPFEFTHQQGVLQYKTLYYNRKMEYPAPVKKYREYEECWGIPAEESAYQGFENIDIEYMRHALQGAADFVKAHPDKILTCGEFGTIKHIPIEYRENYMRDVITICKENDISYCVWNYMSTPNDGNNFSLVDEYKRELFSEELHRVILGK